MRVFLFISCNEVPKKVMWSYKPPFPKKISEENGDFQNTGFQTSQKYAVEFRFHLHLEFLPVVATDHAKVFYHSLQNNRDLFTERN